MNQEAQVLQPWVAHGDKSSQWLIELSRMEDPWKTAKIREEIPLARLHEYYAGIPENDAVSTPEELLKRLMQHFIIYNGMEWKYEEGTTLEEVEPGLPALLLPYFSEEEQQCLRRYNKEVN